MNHLQQVGMTVIFIWRISQEQRNPTFFPVRNVKPTSGLMGFARHVTNGAIFFLTQSSFGPKSCYFFPPGLDTILFLFCNLTIPTKMATCIRNRLVSYSIYDFFIRFATSTLTLYLALSRRIRVVLFFWII